VASSAYTRSVIMVIEPDVIVRTEIAEFLRECGYKVIEGVTAADVWTILNAKVAVDVVFSEVQLPGETDGFALATRVRQRYPQVDVMLSSGVSHAAEKARDLCEDGPVRKPYRAEDVADRIHRLLEGRRSAAKKHR
jgi:DNA-binding NtrC family response regulator